jgi:hypothetical protein
MRDKLGYSLISKKMIGWCLTGSNLCKWKKKIKRWMWLQVATLPLVWSRALHGRGLKILGGLPTALFPAPSTLSSPTPINPNAGQFERQTYSDPISLQIGILGLGNVKQGSSAMTMSVAGRQHLTQWECSENRTEKREKGQKSQSQTKDGTNPPYPQFSARASSWFEGFLKPFSKPRDGDGHSAAGPSLGLWETRGRSRGGHWDRGGGCCKNHWCCCHSSGWDQLGGHPSFYSSSRC